MPTDAHFLAAIAAAPLDSLPKLVYADWLDERGDVRGELIRLEEETRERVAWDETLWKLKPRRNELRKQVPADWLEVMDYGRHCEPLFRGQPFPDNVRDAWRLIREAHERWTGEPMPDVGGQTDKVAEAEKRLGLTLPQSIREFVAFVHDLNQHSEVEWMPVYRDPYRMTLVPGNPALTLISQCEGGWDWAVRLADLDHPDPPVFTYTWGRGEDRERSEEVWVPSDQEPSPSVSHFVFWYAYGYGASEGGGLSVGVRDVNNMRRKLRAAFPFVRSEGDFERFESTDLSATFVVPARYDPGHLDVHLSRPLPRESIPPFLLELCDNGGSFSGVFADEYERRTPGRPRPSESSDETVSDDIPF